MPGYALDCGKGFNANHVTVTVQLCVLPLVEPGSLSGAAQNIRVMLSASVNRVSAHGLEHASATSAPVSVRQQLHVPLRPLGSLMARSSLVAEPAQQEQESTNAATTTPLGAGSPHPDALARRIAAEKRWVEA